MSRWKDIKDVQIDASTVNGLGAGNFFRIYNHAQTDYFDAYTVANGVHIIGWNNLAEGCQNLPMKLAGALIKMNDDLLYMVYRMNTLYIGNVQVGWRSV